MTTQIEQEGVAPAATPSPKTGKGPRRRFIVSMTILVLLAVGIFALDRQQATASILEGTRAVSAEEFAAETGIQVDLIGVIAAGGLVELKFEVVDPDAAENMLHDPKWMPGMVVETSGAELTRDAGHIHGKADFRLGGTYFFIYANTQNALRAGDAVTVVINDVRLEHIPVP